MFPCKLLKSPNFIRVCNHSHFCREILPHVCHPSVTVPPDYKQWLKSSRCPEAPILPVPMKRHSVLHSTVFTDYIP